MKKQNLPKPLIHPDEQHLKNINPVQRLLVEIHRSKPFGSSPDQFLGAKIFKTVKSCAFIPPATETFYLRSKQGSALWFRKWSDLGVMGSDNKDDIEMTSMSPFDASFLWRFCPLLPAPRGSTTSTSEIKGGLLVSGKYPDKCLRCTGGGLIPISINEATVDDLWNFSYNEWRCNTGVISQSFCDHADNGKFSHWIETDVQIVLSSNVSAALAANGVTWENQLSSLPSFIG